MPFGEIGAAKILAAAIDYRNIGKIPRLRVQTFESNSKNMPIQFLMEGDETRLFLIDKLFANILEILIGVDLAKLRTELVGYECQQFGRI